MSTTRLPKRKYLYDLEFYLYESPAFTAFWTLYVLLWQIHCHGRIGILLSYLPYR